MRRPIALCLLPALVAAAADPQVLAPFRLLPLDTRTGMAIADLRPAELSVKLGGETRKVQRIEPFAPEVPVRWILLFAPFQEVRHRAVAFLAAAEFLRQIPEGDQALLIVRDAEGYRAMAPHFSLDRNTWCQQLMLVPGLLPEHLRSAAKSGVSMKVAEGQVEAAGDAQAGAAAAQALVKHIEADPLAFAKGTADRPFRFNTTGQNEAFWQDAAPQSKVIQAEMESVAGLLGQLAGLPGDKHLVVFSRNEADLFLRPDLAAARWEKRIVGRTVVNTSSEYQDIALKPILLARERLKELLRGTGLMLHSVAGGSPRAQGFFGEVALSTGGQAFAVGNGLEGQLPGALLAYRNCLLVTLEGAQPDRGLKVEVQCSRPNTKVIAPRLR